MLRLLCQADVPFSISDTCRKVSGQLHLSGRRCCAQGAAVAVEEREQSHLDGARLAVDLQLEADPLSRVCATFWEARWSALEIRTHIPPAMP